MLLWLWTLPMNAWGWLLVTVSGCTQDVLGFWTAPEKSLLNRWMVKRNFVGITPGYSYIIFKYDYVPSLQTITHELTHAEQHARLGWAFPFVYAWESLVSWLGGTGWYRGNDLEEEAREKAEEVES